MFHSLKHNLSAAAGRGAQLNHYRGSREDNTAVARSRGTAAEKSTYPLTFGAILATRRGISRRVVGPDGADAPDSNIFNRDKLFLQILATGQRLSTGHLPGNRLSMPLEYIRKIVTMQVNHF